MPNRVRTIYQVETVYVGPTPSTGSFFSTTNVTTGASGVVLAASGLINQLTRIQSCNYSFSVPHKDVNQFGELARIDSIIVDSPSVSMDLNWIVANLTNETFLGFVTNNLNVSTLSGILNKTSDDKNYFLKVVGEGVDSVGDTTTGSPVLAIGIGNGFVSSYSVKGSVGNFPTVDVKIEGLNAAIQLGTSGQNPAINPNDGTAYVNAYVLPQAVSSVGTGALAISALRPGDITFSLNKRNSTTNSTGVYDYFGPLISDAKIQDFSIDVNFNREALSRLGSKFAFAREIKFPVVINASINALVGDLTTGNLANFIAEDAFYDFYVTMYAPATSLGATRSTQAIYKVLGAKVQNQSFTTNIGNNKSVKIDFSAQVGGPNQTGNGLFLSGVTAAIAT